MPKNIAITQHVRLSCLWLSRTWTRSPRAQIRKKKPHVCRFSARNSVAGNGCANFMGAWHFLVLSAENPPPMPIKFLLLGGLFGVSWKGGVEVPVLYFMVRGPRMGCWICGRWICVFGALRFSVRRPQNPYFEGFRSDLGQKSGAPQSRIQRPRIQCPMLGPLIWA